MHGCLFFGKPDPGPCPVDDTPHTACTPESVSGGSTTPRGELRVAVHPPFVFTTASYPHPIGEPLTAPLIATAVKVKMTADDGALRKGVTYYMRPVQADGVIARKVGVVVAAKPHPQPPAPAPATKPSTKPPAPPPPRSTRTGSRRHREDAA